MDFRHREELQRAGNRDCGVVAEQLQLGDVKVQNKLQWVHLRLGKTPL